MTVKDRIMEFCRMSGIKPGRFERECGLSNAYLSKLKHEPSRDKLGKIFARYPELNKDWLLNGEGPMLNVVHYPAMEGSPSSPSAGTPCWHPPPRPASREHCCAKRPGGSG